ncbi:MAG: hypothetical protein WC055_02030 [Melioribacteraceae bacterium]
MLTASAIHRYGIEGVWDMYASINDLFSGSDNDPFLNADALAGEIGAVFWDITVAIASKDKCIIQVLVFRNKMGYDKYKSDGVVIFDHKE